MENEDIQVMNRTFLVVAAVVGITAGALFAAYNHEAKQYSENASRIIEMGELAQPVKPRGMHLVDYICRNNSRITRDMAERYVCAVESVLSEYKTDPAYSTGVAPFIDRYREPRGYVHQGERRRNRTYPNHSAFSCQGAPQGGHLAVYGPVIPLGRGKEY